VIPIVLAAIRDQEWQSHVRTTLGAWSRLAFVSHPLDLPGAAAPCPDVVLWHLDLAGPTDECDVAFQRLRRIAPRVALVAYGQVERGIASLFLIAGRVGVDRLLLRGYDDLARNVRSLVASARAGADVDAALEQIGLPAGPAAATVAYCLRRAATGPFTVNQLAEDLQVSRRTLALWLRRAGLPAPERLIGWCRIYGVARQLNDSARSIGQIARDLRFSSDSDLRRMVSRYTGYTPTQLRDRGAASVVVSALRPSIASTRL
jgi:AraC-like DNA-binding protein